VRRIAKKEMNSKDASRIQANADKTGKNQDFKARAQKSASKNSKK